MASQNLVNISLDNTDYMDLAVSWLKKAIKFIDRTQAITWSNIDIHCVSLIGPFVTYFN